jgi:hypothetical protein
LTNRISRPNGVTSLTGQPIDPEFRAFVGQVQSLEHLVRGAVPGVS